MTRSVSRVQFDLVLKVAGLNADNPEQEVTFRCSNHTHTYALNRIPMAACALAVGRDVRTLEAAKIHAEGRNLGFMVPATVVLRPRGQWAAYKPGSGDSQFATGRWTDAGEQVIFRGFVTGVGFRRWRGKFRVTLQLIHWLSDLAFSSVFSNQSHPENPSRYTFQANYPLAVAAAGAAGGRPHFVGQTRFARELSQNNIKTDLWGKALAEAFCEIAKKDLIRIGNPDRCGGVAAPNSQALEALERIEGGHSCADNDNEWHVPLAFSGFGTIGGLIANAIRRYVGQQSMNSWWATTIWDKLIHDFGPAFMFSVVPRAETAVIAPFTPGLREAWDAELTPEDVASIEITSYLRRPLRGVGIFAGREVRTVPTDRSGTDITKQLGIGGCFLPDPDAKGMIILKRAPGWMSSVPALARRARTTVLGRGEDGPPRVTSTSTTPRAEEPVDGGSNAAVESLNVYDALAQYLYVTEVLRGREGVLRGKFRLDIAPGSTLFLEGLGQQAFLSADPDQDGLSLLGEDFYASVLRVSSGLDADSGKAGTVMQLAHIRTAAENDNDRTSVASHPLYKDQIYTGAPIVDEYLFD